MTRILFVLLLVLASCARPPKDGFVVVDPWGSIILRTDNEDEAWRLAAQLTNMGRVLASKPQYFVLKSPRNQGTPDGGAPEQSRW
jgi:hypothetical protein